MSGTSSDLTDLTPINDEANGLLHLYPVRQAFVPAIEHAAALGDGLAMLVASLVGDFLNRHTSPGARPAVCLSCDDPVGAGCTIAVVLPATPAPSQGIAAAVCPVCASTDAQVAARVAESLKFAWPNARAISIHPDAGHA